MSFDNLLFDRDGGRPLLSITYPGILSSFTISVLDQLRRCGRVASTDDTGTAKTTSLEKRKADSRRR
jgi:hypothetical protein